MFWTISSNFAKYFNLIKYRQLAIHITASTGKIQEIQSFFR